MAFVLLASFSAPAHADPLRVAAAANLQKVFTEALMPGVPEKDRGHCGNGDVWSDQSAGDADRERRALIDVFVAADTETVQKLAGERNCWSPATVHPYAIGQLVLWSSASDAAHHPQPSWKTWLTPIYAKIAIANPRTAPYGLAAEQAFTRAGHRRRASRRASSRRRTSARRLQFAQSGNADVSPDRPGAGHRGQDRPVYYCAGRHCMTRSLKAWEWYGRRLRRRRRSSSLIF